MDNVDYSRYPEEAVQKYWIRLYLEEKARQKGLQKLMKSHHFMFVKLTDYDLDCRGRAACSNQQ